MRHDPEYSPHCIVGELHEAPAAVVDRRVSARRQDDAITAGMAQVIAELTAERDRLLTDVCQWRERAGVAAAERDRLAEQRMSDRVAMTTATTR